jgi:hypothetical protein
MFYPNVLQVDDCESFSWLLQRSGGTLIHARVRIFLVIHLAPLAFAKSNLPLASWLFVLFSVNITVFSKSASDSLIEVARFYPSNLEPNENNATVDDWSSRVFGPCPLRDCNKDNVYLFCDGLAYRKIRAVPIADAAESLQDSVVRAGEHAAPMEARSTTADSLSI